MIQHKRGYSFSTDYKFWSEVLQCGPVANILEILTSYRIYKKQTHIRYSPIHNPTGFIRKEILASNNIRYERGYSFSDDYKLWSDIAKVGKLTTIPKVLTLYRRSDEQTSVKHLNQCLEGGQKIKIEMLEYFLSHLKAGHATAETIEKDFFPVIEELGELGFFSEDVFFHFMYELVKGLCQEGAIEL